MEKITFGIIGCGNIGRRHLNFLKEIPEAEVIAVADSIEERAKEASLITGSEFFTDYHKLLENPDINVVNICSPTGLHSEMSIAALNAGKNVLCEKPMCLTVSDADRILEAAKRNNKKFFVVKQNRFNAPIQILRDALEGGNFGKIHNIIVNVLWNRGNSYYEDESWRGTKHLDGGALATQASHFVDILQWIGGDVDHLIAKQDTFNHPIETEDTGHVLIKFKSGAVGSIHYTTCVYNKNMEGSITVLGTKGSAKIGGEYLNKVEHWDVEDFPLPDSSSETSPPNDYGSYRGSSSKHDSVLRTLIKNLNGEEGDLVEGEEAKKTVEIIEAAHISSDQGSNKIFFPLRY